MVTFSIEPIEAYSGEIWKEIWNSYSKKSIWKYRPENFRQFAKVSIR